VEVASIFAKRACPSRLLRPGVVQRSSHLSTIRRNTCHASTEAVSKVS
jgi:hypothetical protein